jgi:hypothetical protein
MVTRGMPAWLAALGALIEPKSLAVSPPQEVAVGVEVIRASDRAELARVLAGMVRVCMQEDR